VRIYSLNLRGNTEGSGSPVWCFDGGANNVCVKIWRLCNINRTSEFYWLFNGCNEYL